MWVCVQAGRRMRLIGGTHLAGKLDQIKQHCVPVFQPGQISNDIKRKLANERRATTKSGLFQIYTSAWSFTYFEPQTSLSSVTDLSHGNWPKREDTVLTLSSCRHIIKYLEGHRQRDALLSECLIPGNKQRLHGADGTKTLSYVRNIMRRPGFDKDILLRHAGGKLRRWRQPISWFEEIKWWTGMMVTAAIRAASDRWSGIVMTATQNAITE